MTVANGNGRRKKSEAEVPTTPSTSTEQAPAPLSASIPEDVVKTTQELERLLNEKAAARQPEGDIKNVMANTESTPQLGQQPNTDTPVTSPEEKAAQEEEQPVSKKTSKVESASCSTEAAQQPEPTAEELLRQSKAATKEQPVQQPKGEEKEEGGAIAQTATSQIAQATAQQAQGLLEANKQAQETLLGMGMREGIEDAKLIRQGYQMGLLASLTQSKVTDTNDLAEQLPALRSHTDESNGDMVSQMLSKLMGEKQGKINPLDIKKNLPQSKERFKIV